MDVKDKVAVVTGGAQGIGLALCTRFAQEGALVVLSDLNQEKCEREAAPIGALPVAADVGREEDVANLVSATLERFGRIDLFVSNAGIAIDGGLDTPTEKWRNIIDVNLMSEVWAAKYAVPHMLEQGSGYLLNVASAAGLLVIPDTVGYTVTKHAAIGFTEWLTAIGASASVCSARRPSARRFSRARRTPSRGGTRSPRSSSPISSWTGSPRSAS